MTRRPSLSEAGFLVSTCTGTLLRLSGNYSAVRGGCELSGTEAMAAGILKIEGGLLIARAPGEAPEFEWEMERPLGAGPRPVVDISPVIGLNAGPGSLALVFLPKGKEGGAVRAR